MLKILRGPFHLRKRPLSINAVFAQNESKNGVYTEGSLEFEKLLWFNRD
jgi:hypothetical protein